MPLWAKFYIAIFILFTLSNMGLALYMKNKIILILYDLFVNLFFSLAMISYWKQTLRAWMNPVVAIIFFALLFLEVYLTTTRSYEKLGITIPEGITQEGLDRAAFVSILFAAPAYILGGLSMLNILVGK